MKKQIRNLVIEAFIIGAVFGAAIGFTTYSQIVKKDVLQQRENIKILEKIYRESK